MPLISPARSTIVLTELPQKCPILHRSARLTAVYFDRSSADFAVYLRAFEICCESLPLLMRRVCTWSGHGFSRPEPHDGKHGLPRKNRLPDSVGPCVLARSLSMTLVLVVFPISALPMMCSVMKHETGYRVLKPPVSQNPIRPRIPSENFWMI